MGENVQNLAANIAAYFGTFAVLIECFLAFGTSFPSPTPSRLCGHTASTSCHYARSSVDPDFTGRDLDTMQRTVSEAFFYFFFGVLTPSQAQRQFSEDRPATRRPLIPRCCRRHS